MNDVDIRSNVRTVVEEVLELDPGELRDNGDFMHEYGCTSLQFMDMMQEIERKLGLRYLPAETEQMVCVDDVVQLTQQRLADRAAL